MKIGMKLHLSTAFTLASALSPITSQPRYAGSTAGGDASACRRRSTAVFYWAQFICCLALLIGCLLDRPAHAQLGGPNVNMVSGTQWPTGDPFLQRQNEPAMAVSTRNPMHVLAGANDYRTVDLEIELSGGAETGDAWLGLFKSFDGGLSWQSTLLPGCPEQSVPQCVDNGALAGNYQAAADPVVRAGTNGMFFYAGLAFDRASGPVTASSVSSVFVARYNDLNNNENLDTITYIDTHVVASGNASQFLDKPAMAVDIPRSGAGSCSFTASEPGAGPNGKNLSVPQSFPAGNVYLAYTDFLAATKSNATPTHLMFTRSTNCGVTWSAPIQLNTGTTTSQGSAIAVNALNGNVYVAWRQFASTGIPNAIMAAVSTNAGKSFSAPVQISTFQPFDQGTTDTSFRTNAYPSITTDMFGFVYVAFSARDLVPSGDARIVVAGSINGTSWTPAIMVDNPSQNAQTNPSGRGHQIMPAITFAQGRLTLLYYDLRLDHYVGLYNPNSSSLTGYSETLEPEGELAPPDPMPNLVFTPYIDDYGLTMRRHTIDLRVLELGIFPTVTLGPSQLISQYSYGCCVNPLLPDIEQYKFNVPNLPLFAQGEEPFLGDYIDLVASPMFVPSGGSWTYNFTPSVNPLFHAAWTDNRDVVPPANGNWEDYTPAVPNGTPSVFQPGSAVPDCQVGQEGMRNQNIYTSQITGGLVVGAPGNAKTLGTTTFNGQVVPFQRAFAVEAQNVTDQVIYVQMSIANQPTGGNASFLQFSSLTTLQLTIPAYSSVSRSVFVTSSSPEASVTVNVSQITGIGGSVVTNGLSGSAVLNPDSTNPSITNPDINNPDINNPNINNLEVNSATITTPNINNPNINNPNINNPDINNPNINNPDINNPNINNATVATVSAATPNINNPDINNPDINNPNINNPNINNQDIANGSIQDVSYGVLNNGNTDSAYTVKLSSTGTVPNGIVLQLIVNKLYQTPAAQSCQLTLQTHWNTVANIINPKLYAPSDPNLGNPDINNSTPDEATVTLRPAEMAYITVRVVNPTPQQTPFNPLNTIIPVTVAQAVPTATVLSNPGNTNLTPPVVYPQLAILTPALPPTDRNDAGYSVQLIATGGKPGAQTWSVVSGALPSGINLSPTGLVSGTAGPNGSFPVTIRVADTNSPPDVATQNYVLNVSINALTTQIAMLAPDGVVGQPYVATPLMVTGGTSPYVFMATGLPPGLAINPSTGQISGTPTTANPLGSSVTITATDSATPAESQPYTTPIGVGAVIQISPATLPSGIIGLPYSAQLSATGGIGALVFGPSSPASGVTLSSSGLLTILSPAASSISFSVSAHDQAIPTNQVQTANYTIQFATAVSHVSNLTFVTQPSNTPVSQTITPPVQVRATDSSAAVLPGVSISLTLSGPGTLGGTLTQTTDATGTAPFPNLSISAAGTGDTLQAAAGNVTATSNAFNITGTPRVCALVPYPPLSWYPFNGNALDIRGGRHGTLFGTGTFVPAEVGQGYKGGATAGSGITVQDGQYLEQVNLTVGAWLRVDNLDPVPFMPVVWQGDGAGDTGSTSYSLAVEGTATFTSSSGNATRIGTPGAGKVVVIISNGNIETDVFSNATLSPGTFYYVAFSIGGGVNLWINGALDTLSTSSPPIAISQYPYQIGGIQNGNAVFDGVINQLQIWGTPLTNSQISSIYNAGTAGECQDLWFTESAVSKVGTITPGAPTASSDLSTTTPASLPYGVTVGPDGNVWFTEYTPNNIGMLEFLGGSEGIGEFPVNNMNGAGAYAITTGPDGNLWFSEALTPEDGSFVGRVSTSGTINLYQVGFSSPIHGIAAGPDGNLWFAQNSANAIGNINPLAPTSVNSYSIPTTANPGPESITVGPDGNMWFTEYNASQIGVITTGGTVTHQYATTTTVSNPFGIALGPDGNLWFTEFTGNKIGVITTSGTITEYSIPTTNSGPKGITLGPDGNLWFVESTANQIGMIVPGTGSITEFPTPTAGSAPWGISTGPTTSAAYAPPAPPTNVTGSSPFGEPVISWTASAGPNVVGYNVYRSYPGQNGPFTLVGNVTGTSFTDINASNAATACGTNLFYYVVTAIGSGSSESSFSNEVSAPVQGPC